jgi:hypothetical protein
VAGLEMGRAGLAEARRLGLRGAAVVLAGNVVEVARWTGDWEWALNELAPFLEGDLDVVQRSWLLTGCVILRGWRGEVVDEELAELRQIQEARPTDAFAAGDRADLESCLGLAMGRFAEARAAAHDMARLSPLNAPAAHPMAVRAALWMRDPVAAAEDLAALEATRARGPFVALRRTAFRAGLAALEGRTPEARSLYAEARRGLLDRGVIFEAALVAIDMATLLGPDDSDAVDAAAEARPSLERLSARPFLARLEAALAGEADERVVPKGA